MMNIIVQSHAFISTMICPLSCIKKPSTHNPIKLARISRIRPPLNIIVSGIKKKHSKQSNPNTHNLRPKRPNYHKSKPQNVHRPPRKLHLRPLLPPKIYLPLSLPLHYPYRPHPTGNLSMFLLRRSRPRGFEPPHRDIHQTAENRRSL